MLEGYHTYLNRVSSYTSGRCTPYYISELFVWSLWASDRPDVLQVAAVSVMCFVSHGANMGWGFSTDCCAAPHHISLDDVYRPIVVDCRPQDEEGLAALSGSSDERL